MCNTEEILNAEEANENEEKKLVMDDNRYQALENSFIDYLKINKLIDAKHHRPNCPYCGQPCSILNETEWRCPHCKTGGNVIDYVMTTRKNIDRITAAKEICRCLDFKGGPVEALSHEEILDMQFALKPDVVKGLIPSGLTLLAGSSKCGKSIMSLQLACSVAKGEPFLGFPTSQCGVLYLALEDTYRRIQRRLVQMGELQPTDLHVINDAQKLNHGLEEQLRHLFTLEEYKNTHLVIIDTLQKIRGGDLMCSSYGKDYFVLNTLEDLAKELDVSILLIHHLRKAPAEDVFERITGSTGIMGATDACLILNREDRESPDAELYVTGRDVNTQKHIIELDDEKTLRWEIIQKDAKIKVRNPHDYELSLVKKFVKEKHHWRGTAAELAEELKKMDEDFSGSSSSIVRILNANTEELAEDYYVNYRNKRVGNQKMLTFDEIEGEKPTEESKNSEARGRRKAEVMSEELFGTVEKAEKMKSPEKEEIPAEEDMCVVA